MTMRFFRLVLCTLSLTVAVSAYADAAPIRDFRVNGTQRIDAGTVINYLGLRLGDEADEVTLNEALKNLFATGLFADVTIGERGGVVTVNVVENPIINQIAFEGNKKLKDEELAREISLKPRQVFTRTRAQNDVARVYELYRRSGRFAASVDPKIIQLDQNRVNLVFEIVEGEESRIQGIRFVGNKVYDSDTLRSEINSKENRWYRFMSSDDLYDPDRMQYDAELLRRFYLKNGYADFRVISANAELREGTDDFYLTYTVEEGPRYRIGQVAIDSDLRGFDANALREASTVLPGQWYDADRVQQTADAMTDALGDLQYAFITVRPEVSRRTQAETVDLTFKIGESPRVFVERINIHGNVRTIDKVVRREMMLAEGDPFNRSKLARSEQKLRDLNFFEKVNVTTQPGSAPDKTVIDIEVAEKSTGEISLGAGFSTSDGPLADLRLRERNFLGKGQDVLFATTLAGSRTQFDFSFTEPYFLDRDLQAGIDAFHMTRDFQDEANYDQRRTGGGFRIGYPLSEKWRQTFKYRYEINEIENVGAGASLYVRQQQGKRKTSAVGQRLTYDSRDSVLFPTEGLYSWLDAEVAGLGGDAQYLSGTLGGSYYIPMAERKVVLNLLGEAGAITGYGGEDVRINERFYLGGSNLRGFERGGVGPRDAATGDSLGGNYFYRGSAELSFPVFLPEEMGILGHAFTDFGSIWEIDQTGPGILDEQTIRASAGFGLSWRSPMGPLRFDLAFPYAKEDFDKDEVFRFSFGTRF